MSQVPGRLLLLGDIVDMSLLYVGHVRLDTVRDAASSLWGGMDDLEVTECPFATRPAAESAHWCRAGVAVRVRFDGRNAIGRLRMPSLYREPSSRSAQRHDHPAVALRNHLPQRA